jgi:cyclase
MLVTARDRMRTMVQEGRPEEEVLAARPLKDLDAKWAANDQAAANFLRVVYNSFKRS